MYVKRVLTGLALSLMALSLMALGCGGDGTREAQGPGAKDKYVIAFSQCNGAEEYRATQNKIMQHGIKQYPDCELLIADALQDNARQISQIENFILQDVDVLIVAPNEAAPLTGIVKRAHESGIKVVCLERNILEPAYDVFVGADNVKIGEAAGQWIAEKLEGVDSPVIVEMRGLLGTKPQEERHEGARKHIDQIPNVRVIEEVANWVKDEAKKRMETVLQANPGIDLVYAHNDPMADGAYLAAREAGRQDDILFVGVDGLATPDGGIKKVMEGVLDCTFYYPRCASEGLEYAVKLAHGEHIENKEVILDTFQITPENAAEWWEKLSAEREQVSQ